MSVLMPLGFGPVEDRDERQLDEVADALQRPGVTVGSTSLAELPAPIREALADVLHRFARGESVVVGSAETLLTTSEAAKVLGISRTYLVRMIDAGELACEFVGTHRRIRLGEALRFGEVFRERRRAALDEVSRTAREAGLYEDDEF